MAADTLPVEVLFGIYLGLLTGIVPALASWTLGFVFKYVTDVSIPGFGVVVLALGIAGVNGGLLALNDPTIREEASAPVVIVAIIVVLMLSFYAHNRGDAMGATVPRRLSLRGLRERTLSADVVDLVGGHGRVRVTVAGEVGDIEGYPPVPADVRAAIRDGEWTLPADLPLGDLETRLAERLRTEFDLADVSVSMDEQGRASVVAAPPLSGLSKRVPHGERAVSVEALLPTGLARGEEVTLHTESTVVEGTVVSARSDGGTTAPGPPGGPEEASAGAAGTVATTGAESAATTHGGQGRVTVAVARADAEDLLGADRATVVVRSRGTRREFELVSLLRRAGNRFRKLTVGAGSRVAGTTLADAEPRSTHGVAVLAVGGTDGWVLAPPGSTELTAGDVLVAVGPSDALRAFAEVTA